MVDGRFPCRGAGRVLVETRLLQTSNNLRQASREKPVLSCSGNCGFWTFGRIFAPGKSWKLTPVGGISRALSTAQSVFFEKFFEIGSARNPGKFSDSMETRRHRPATPPPSPHTRAGFCRGESSGATSHAQTTPARRTQRQTSRRAAHKNSAGRPSVCRA